MHNQSEVAYLLQQIDAEYQAARTGLQGFASGNARHAFISARMERVHQAGEQLIEVLGCDEALPLIIHIMEQATQIPAEQ